MSKTILIAASDPNIIYLLQRYAEASGFQSVIAVQGTDLENQVKSINPVLIVLEIELPGNVGMLNLRNLKNSPNTSTIPVLVYSCFDEITNMALEGVSGYLQKSIMYSDFQAAVSQAGVRVGSHSDLDEQTSAG
jgi:two-component system alkaline phosphatase synthesis response regulator PhoP